MSKQLFVPLENLVFKNPAANPTPTDVSYPEEARRLLPSSAGSPTAAT